MNDETFPKIKDAILLCLLWMGIAAAGGFLLYIIEFSNIYSIPGLLLVITPSAIIIYICWKKTNISFKQLFQYKNIPFSFICYATLFTIGFVIFAEEINNIIYYISPSTSIYGVYYSRETLIKLNPVFAFISICIIPAFSEEIIFRGIFISGFKNHYSMKKAIIAGAIIFGLLHIDPRNIIPSFFLGLFLGWIFYKTESIVLCVYVHLLYNFVYLFRVLFPEVATFEGYNSPYGPNRWFLPIWVDIIGIALMINGIFFFQKIFNDQAELENVEIMQ